MIFILSFIFLIAKECAKAKPGNIIISPLSVATSLALLSQAAGSSTFDELRAGLHLSGSDKSAIANDFSNFDVQLQQNLGNSTFSSANRIYVLKTLKLNPEFADVATSKFHSGVESIDFGDKPKAAEIISNFVEENTNGNIKNFLTADTMSDDLVTIIVNAIYFQSSWEVPFNKEQTRAGNFFINENENISTDFMVTIVILDGIFSMFKFLIFFVLFLLFYFKSHNLHITIWQLSRNWMHLQLN